MTWEAYELFRVGEQGMIRFFAPESGANNTSRFGFGPGRFCYLYSHQCGVGRADEDHLRLLRPDGCDSRSRENKWDGRP